MNFPESFRLLALLAALPWLADLTADAANVLPARPILAGDPPRPWRIIIANDTCPDVTWGFTEAQTRRAFADLIAARTRADREMAEWCWTMLSDHAWNGADLKNKRHNAELRRAWADRLAHLSRPLTHQAWNELGLETNNRHLTVFNPLSFARDIPVECAVPAEVTGVKGSPSQVGGEAPRRTLVFVASAVPAFGFRHVLRAQAPGDANAAALAWSRGAAAPLTLTVPGYRRATETDLLERDRGPLPAPPGRVFINVRGHGFSAVKLER